jgi:DNA-binding NtrC family response regulator
MSPNRLYRLTIVVVEDHDDARAYLGLFLERLGATVVAARNAFEGIEAVKNSRPNLVLSDISMPDRDGQRRSKSTIALGNANSFKTAQNSCRFWVERLMPKIDLRPTD